MVIFTLASQIHPMREKQLRVIIMINISDVIGVRAIAHSLLESCDIINSQIIHLHSRTVTLSVEKPVAEAWFMSVYNILRE